MSRLAVSVIMPALNAEPWLPAAIESILGQTFEDLELIVVDDGSEDASVDIARDYESRDPRVRVIALPRDPRTESGARASNVALDAARGEYVARMDADDVALATRLETQLATLRERNLDVCGGLIERFGDQSGVVWVPEGRDAIAAELVFRACFTLPTMLARADVLKRARFSETEAYEEYELQTRLAPQARLGNCPEVVLRVRFHARQTTRTLRHRKSQSHWRSRFRYFFACFPGASLADFQSVNAIPRGHAFADRDDLERAGRWLLRLSRLPDPRLRARMAQRWDDACDRFFDAGRGDDLRDSVQRQILAPP
jgi:glycosyltransferase involved in cell wall biosynthesis